MKELKAIGENIFIEEIGLIKSTVIQVVSDKKNTYRKGRVLSVGDEVTSNIKEGDIVIFTDAVPQVEDKDPVTHKLTTYYVGNEDSIYCKCV